MTKTYTAPYVQSVNNAEGVITSALGAGAKVDIFMAGANDSVLKSLVFTSDDTTARVVQVFVNVGGTGTDRLIGAVTVAIAAGSNGTTAAVDVLRSTLLLWSSYDANGNRCLHLEPGSIVRIASTTALTSGKSIHAFGEGADY